MAEQGDLVTTRQTLDDLAATLEHEATAEQLARLEAAGLIYDRGIEWCLTDEGEARVASTLRACLVLLAEPSR